MISKAFFFQITVTKQFNLSNIRSTHGTHSSLIQQDLSHIPCPSGTVPAFFNTLLTKS
jgi:hypothetical protein